jgi:hypothetical protein
MCLAKCAQLALFDLPTKTLTVDTDTTRKPLPRIKLVEEARRGMAAWRDFNLLSAGNQLAVVCFGGD